MICEDYVSFETAKLLKEKGFDEECSFAFYKDGRIVDRYDSEFSYNYYDRPTLQMAIKWLREVHRLFINIFLCDKPNNFEYNIYKIHDTYLEVVDNEEIFHYNTYEEAAEAVIKHCLENLI